ncbi:MAG: sigma-70 family RNA polymerase sigma factor [Pseudomonadota bacterium]
MCAQYRQSYSRLTSIAAGILGRKEDAEDMVQQAVSIAVEKQTRFESAGHFIGWLCSTVRNCSLNHRRKFTGRRTTPADPAVLSTVTEDPSRQTRVERVSRATGELFDDQQAFDDRMMQALQTLAPEMRSCLLLRIVENLSYAEIAGMMAMPEGTAMSHVHRARKKLREVLGSPHAPEGGDA